MIKSRKNKVMFFLVLLNLIIKVTYVVSKKNFKKICKFKFFISLKADFKIKKKDC